MRLALLGVCALVGVVSAQDPLARIEQETAKVAPAVIEIRHQIHQNPELSNHEEQTAALVADYLRKLGLEVKTGVARHGVVALLKGGKPDRWWRCADHWTGRSVTEETNSRMPRRCDRRISVRRSA